MEVGHADLDDSCRRTGQAVKLESYAPSGLVGGAGGNGLDAPRVPRHVAYLERVR